MSQTFVTCVRCGAMSPDDKAAAIDCFRDDYVANSGGSPDHSFELCRKCYAEGLRMIRAWVRQR